MIEFSVTQWHHFSVKMIMNTGKGVTTARCSLKYMHLPEITENKTSVWIRGLSMFLISKSWSTSNNQSCSVLSSPKSHTHFQTAHLIKLCGYRLDEWETIFNSCQDQIIFSSAEWLDHIPAPYISMRIFLSPPPPADFGDVHLHKHLQYIKISH